jgi:hypothetical protein
VNAFFPRVAHFKRPTATTVAALGLSLSKANSFKMTIVLASGNVTFKEGIEARKNNAYHQNSLLSHIDILLVSIHLVHFYMQ